MVVVFSEKPKMIWGLLWPNVHSCGPNKNSSEPKTSLAAAKTAKLLPLGANCRHGLYCPLEVFNVLCGRAFIPESEMAPRWQHGWDNGQGPDGRRPQ